MALRGLPRKKVLKDRRIAKIIRACRCCLVRNCFSTSMMRAKLRT
jgi:hypothetical protein